MNYELKLENFQGPLDKLLELIEERRMEISEVSLAEVTDDFLKYLKTRINAGGIGGDSHASQRESAAYLRLLADFVSVASRLIFLKSKYLLPSAAAEEEKEIKELEERLKIYKEFKPAAKIISALWREGKNEFGRQYFLSLGAAENLKLFYPAKNLKTEAILNSISKIFDDWQKISLENHTLKGEFISIEEKIREVVRQIEEFGRLTFNNLAENRGRGEVIAVFLAILYLARERLILLEQRGKFSDIMITRPEITNVSE